LSRNRPAAQSISGGAGGVHFSCRFLRQTGSRNRPLVEAPIGPDARPPKPCLSPVCPEEPTVTSVPHRTPVPSLLVASSGATDELFAFPRLAAPKPQANPGPRASPALLVGDQKMFGAYATPASLVSMNGSGARTREAQEDEGSCQFASCRVQAFGAVHAPTGASGFRRVGIQPATRRPLVQRLLRHAGRRELGYPIRAKWARSLPHRGTFRHPMPARDLEIEGPTSGGVADRAQRQMANRPAIPTGRPPGMTSPRTSRSCPGCCVGARPGYPRHVQDGS
jgi:hypothetical protein